MRSGWVGGGWSAAGYCLVVMMALKRSTDGVGWTVVVVLVQVLPLSSREDEEWVL